MVYERTGVQGKTNDHCGDMGVFFNPLMRKWKIVTSNQNGEKHEIHFTLTLQIIEVSTQDIFKL